MSRKVVEAVLTPRDAKELWTAGYRPALPIVLNDFALGSVLPAVLYMMRWGCRRGKGRFFSEYGQEPSIARVAKLLSRDDSLIGFAGDVQQAILGDLLLAFCLENRHHRLGRDEQVQRVFPTHYFSSWVDLPLDVANLRGVPELVVGLLARQQEGATISRGTGGLYAVGTGFGGNRLLALLGPGTAIEGQPDNLKSDRFDENAELSVDQLLTVRLAQSLGEAPSKLRGQNPEIPNQRPVALRAAEQFYEDINIFLRAYGEHIPRQSLLSMLESGLCIGLTNIYLSTVYALLHWAGAGVLQAKNEQPPWPLFVDCSMSADLVLRRLSEECVDDLLHRMGRLPVIMMCLQILDQRARQEKLLPPLEPDPTARINFLGDLLQGRLEQSRDIARDLDRNCNRLAEELKEDGSSEAVTILENGVVAPAWRLAEALVLLMGEKVQFRHFRQGLDACLMIDQPNGLARKRKSTVRGKGAERRSVVLTNTVLDFLVHRHLRKAKKGTGPTRLSLARFIDVLKDRYGFYIGESPPGMAVPADLLRRNRAFLERRLRDLGLFVGVNDAESMKRLRERFQVEEADDD
jgi:hypothetical protein